MNIDILNSLWCYSGWWNSSYSLNMDQVSWIIADGLAARQWPIPRSITSWTMPRSTSSGWIIAAADAAAAVDVRMAMPWVDKRTATVVNANGPIPWVLRPMAGWYKSCRPSVTLFDIGHVAWVAAIVSEHLLIEALFLRISESKDLKKKGKDMVARLVLAIFCVILASAVTKPVIPSSVDIHDDSIASKFIEVSNNFNESMFLSMFLSIFLLQALKELLPIAMKAILMVIVIGALALFRKYICRRRCSRAEQDIRVRNLIFRV